MVPAWVEAYRAIVRPNLAHGFAAAIIIAVFIDTEAAKTLIGIGGPIIGYYVSSREKKDQP